jgi:hypothetical protein
MPSTSVAISKPKPGKPRPALAIVALVPGCDGADPLVEFTLRDPDGEGKREPEKRQRRVDTLLQLREAGKIEDYQYTAGRNFQEDCQHAELRVRSSAEITPGGSVAWFGIADAKLVGIAASSRAKARVKSALGRLGHRAELFALRVLIDRWAPTEAALENGWRPNNAIAALRLILDVLDRFYAEIRRGDLK